MKRSHAKRWIALAIAFVVYTTLLLVSHAVAPKPRTHPIPGGTFFTTSSQTAEGGIVPSRVDMAYRMWNGAVSATNGLAPVILLHGSPGAGANFNTLGPMIARLGRDVITVDLPGFGASTIDIPDYSTRAHARYTLALMDHLGMDRAHVVGWSMGGGVGLEMADIAPGRVASMTLLGAIAAQETEGSGSYIFEHAKYALGYAALVIGPDLLPHFGVIGGESGRRAFMRNFFDTDQRPGAEMLRRDITPLLIIHGRRDFLVSDWAAERHHELAPSSSLVMTPYSHFLPLDPTQALESVTIMSPFFDRHDDQAAEAVRMTTDLAPVTDRGWVDWIASIVRTAPWWSLVIALAIMARWKLDLTTGFAAFMVVDQSLDVGVAVLAIFIATLTRERSWWEGRGLALWGPRIGWPIVVAVLLSILTPAFVSLGPHRQYGALAGVGLWLGLSVALGFFRRVATRMGRRRFFAGLRRCFHHEWWPAWVLYAPIVPRLVALGLRHGGLMTWTCANPGVEPGGGVVGECKSAIMAGFPADAGFVVGCLPVRRTNDASRDAASVDEMVRTDPALDGYPCVLKPETGYRGVGVRVARNADDVRAYLEHAHRDVCVQRYHAGPHEIGVLWARDPATIDDKHHEDATKHDHEGSVLAITRKTFPIITGDGRRTIRKLVASDARLCMQADVFFEKLGQGFDAVPAKGEVVAVSTTGNHAQGCVFTDGIDLLTPELSSAIDALMRSWRGPGGEPFDFGRFDIRYRDEPAMKRGEDIGVIELNGVTSEATSLYDPEKSVIWAWGLMMRQWRAVFAIGARRRELGREPMRIGELARAMMRVRNRD